LQEKIKNLENENRIFIIIIKKIFNMFFNNFIVMFLWNFIFLWNLIINLYLIIGLIYLIINNINFILTIIYITITYLHTKIILLLKNYIIKNNNNIEFDKNIVQKIKTNGICFHLKRLCKVNDKYRLYVYPISQLPSKTMEKSSKKRNVNKNDLHIILTEKIDQTYLEDIQEYFDDQWYDTEIEKFHFYGLFDDNGIFTINYYISKESEKLYKLLSQICNSKDIKISLKYIKK
jgi:hypothetical protein